VAETIDHGKATRLLMDLILNSPTDPLSGLPSNRRHVVEGAMLNEDELRTILHGPHLTFRYMLFTALLAKSVNPVVNARSLQAGWEIEGNPVPGAYDARSLCHKVIVVIEREFLGNRLGGSNEPYLNKPARYQSIELDNPVQKGKFQLLLNLLHKLTEELNAQPDYAIYSLDLAIKLVLELDSRVNTSYEFVSPQISTAEVIDIFSELIERGCEGQSLVIVFCAIMKTRLSDLEITCHPVNQAGSSSNEIGDVDFSSENKVVMCAELKDKEYFPSDLMHAVDKAVAGECSKMLIVEGPRALLSATEDEKTKLSEDISNSGLDVLRIKVDRNWLATHLELLTTNQLLDVIGLLLATTEEIRASSLTINWLNDILSRAGIEYRANS